VQVRNTDVIVVKLLTLGEVSLNFKCFLGNFSLDAWLGMRKWVSNIADLTSTSTTRQDYDEKGGEYLKEHQMSNQYIPTPVTL
jgi:hypothetical protein